MKICPRLIISDCTLRIFRGYDFRIFKILLFLDRYFGVFYSDLRASPRIFSYEVPPGGNNTETKGHLFSQGGGGYTSISLTGMLIREQISTTPKKIECPKIQNQKNRMTQDAMLVKV